MIRLPWTLDAAPPLHQHADDEAPGRTGAVETAPCTPFGASATPVVRFGILERLDDDA